MTKKLTLLLILVVCGFSVSAQSKLIKPVIAEIIIPGDAGLKIVRTTYAGTKVENIKQWKNRMVIYAKTSDAASFRKTVVHDYPGDKVVFFENPFYDFERTICSDKTIAKQWDNTIISANLVDNSKLQEEYLDYHATQFSKWPEVSQGFCNAGFQQLLVFKTGRQLMLVISIPHGKMLDELNPLTTKNNPRVNDWNNMMKKYQEGIEGTKKGEVWVEFKDIDTKN
jgi:hypothetical protein